MIIKKYIREILLHFNLPFEKDSLEPSRKEIVRVAGETFEEITGIRLSDLNLQIWVDEFINRLRAPVSYTHLEVRTDRFCHEKKSRN